MQTILAPGHEEFMAEPLSAGQTDEYLRLRAFVEVVCQRVLSASFPRDIHPIVVLDRLHAGCPSEALRGAREAAYDLVEATMHMPPAELATLEASLAEAGAPSLQAMRDKTMAEIHAILSRGEILCDDEWRLLATATADMTDRDLPNELRQRADDLLARYESSRGA